MKTLEEKKEEALLDFKKMVAHMVSDLFKTHESFEPTVFFLVVDGDKMKIGIMPDIGKLFINDVGKELASQIIRKVNDEIKPIALAFAAEGWAVIKHHDSKKGPYKYEGPRPSESPEKQEILFINFETFDKECNMGWTIVRDIIPGGELVPKGELETQWEIKSDRFQGRFTNLLTDNYSELNKLANKAKDNTN